MMGSSSIRCAQPAIPLRGGPTPPSNVARSEATPAPRPPLRRARGGMNGLQRGNAGPMTDDARAHTQARLERSEIDRFDVVPRAGIWT